MSWMDGRHHHHRAGYFFSLCPVGRVSNCRVRRGEHGQGDVGGASSVTAQSVMVRAGKATSDTHGFGWLIRVDGGMCSGSSGGARTASMGGSKYRRQGDVDHRGNGG